MSKAYLTHMSRQRERLQKWRQVGTRNPVPECPACSERSGAWLCPQCLRWFCSLCVREHAMEQAKSSAG